MVYSLFTYLTGMKYFDLGYAAVQGLLLIVMMMIVTFFFKRMREICKQGNTSTYMVCETGSSRSCYCSVSCLGIVPVLLGADDLAEKTGRDVHRSRVRRSISPISTDLRKLAI